jgi:hypothetical protein
MPATGQRALQRALLDVGRGELGHAADDGPFVEECLNAGNPRLVRYKNMAWCVGAVNRWYLGADGKLPWLFTLSCDTLKSLLEKKGWYYPFKPDGTFVPQPGDLIFFDWDHDQDRDHVSIVKEWHPEGGYVLTVGGNERRKGYPDQVRVQDRRLSFLSGFGQVPDSP